MKRTIYYVMLVPGKEPRPLWCNEGMEEFGLQYVESRRFFPFNCVEESYRRRKWGDDLHKFTTPYTLCLETEKLLVNEEGKLVALEMVSQDMTLIELEPLPKEAIGSCVELL